MAQHIIPEYEKELHEETSDCSCGPEFKMDNETGEMVWVHKLLDAESLFDNFIKV